MREIQILAKINNDFIVQYKNAWLENYQHKHEKIPTLFIQLELCSNTLREEIKILNEELSQNFDSGMTPVGAYIASQIFLEIVEGVNYLHSNKPKIIHRDLKLSNILMKKRPGGKLIKICDFGLSTIHELFEVVDDNEEIIHTTGVGTQRYIAPEVVNGGNYNEKSDMYSLGIIIMDMFCIRENRYFLTLR
jgi:translation initiation factor 2-alpha kinase 1